ncbi:di-trans,poly-cis-decaprenylcistransferase [Alkalicaulis satelles]|uniref:Isoprenyl transferase n=1 Tax=Alkalicaulis satelles TaxID=2609175 RepID=A0A5M6ZB16_9PROT|nr:polyprenyl diphosphate synthase [Alkalicaulis satelles]KAA5801585.1 di-trans,poly-cis-decaprenylcistransferase [Alkalicaulis satelles]
MAQPDAKDRLPRHVAIIMDGNGRWAAARGLPRAFGHKAGVEAVRKAVRAAGDLGLTHLTLFSFSTENWRRPAAEIDTLFDLLRQYVAADLESLHAEGVRVRIIGRRKGLTADLQATIDRVEARTRHNDKFHLTIAFNYGGRDELVRAAARAARASGGDLSELTEAGLESHLDTAGLPDPDLVIRTSGERRLSNFLLWQAAYAELILIDVLWPDFGEADLRAALDEYARRERRFGAVRA